MNQKTKNNIRTAGRILFGIYICMLVYALFFSEIYGRNSFAGQAYHYNLVPFREIRRFWKYRRQIGFWGSYLNLAGNVIGFWPFGFFLPVVHRKLRKGWLVTLAGFLFSLCVETAQLVWRVGCFDVDDMILNTLGAMSGYWIFLLCDRIRRHCYGKKV